jgi:3-hexulose-6-phosphate synthase
VWAMSHPLTELGYATMGTPNKPAGAIVQVCIDVRTAEEALAVAEMAVRAGVDWLEVGTPMILFSGIPVIEQLASAWPDRTIFADIKIVDGARKYVVAAAGHGAHIVSVCGIATDATIREAIAGGREVGAQVCVDLYASPDPVARAREVVAMGADLVYLHYGGDQRAAYPDGDRTLAQIPLVRQVVDAPIGVVTFEGPNAVAAIEAGADIVLIGHPFLIGPDAEGMLTDYVRQVRSAVRA